MKEFKIKDKLTNQEFYPKRKNQRFSSAKNRVNYHNKIARQVTAEKAFINEPLNKNHKILMSLLNEFEILVVERKKLIELGYNFNAFTHIENYNGHACSGLFNFCVIQEIDSIENITIVRKNTTNILNN